MDGKFLVVSPSLLNGPSFLHYFPLPFISPQTAVETRPRCTTFCPRSSALEALQMLTTTTTPSTAFKGRGRRKRGPPAAETAKDDSSSIDNGAVAAAAPPQRSGSASTRVRPPRDSIGCKYELYEATTTFSEFTVERLTAARAPSQSDK